MRKIIAYLSVFAMAVVFLSCCKGKDKGRTISACEVEASPELHHGEEPVANHDRYIPLPNPPAIMIGQEQIKDFYRFHFWDNLQPSMYEESVDTMMMLNSFVAYLQLLTEGGVPDAKPIEKLMEKCITDKPLMDLFSMLADHILNDPNSPYREDEFYIPVLQARISSGLYDQASQIRDRHTLELAMQNRIGQKANDFKYTLKDGSSGTLYGIKAPFTLIFITNPGCSMCRTIRESICASRYLMQLIDDGTMQVVGIYPDEDLDEWNEYYDEIPSNWINGYDEGCTIRRNGTYKLNAIPALYLLDADKMVLVKDGTDVAAIERILAR